MQRYLPERADEFCNFHRRIEDALLQNDYARNDRKKAHVDWHRFANELTDAFFHELLASKKAATLITEPPRAYYREGGWQPETPHPIEDVAALISGIRQVRHNIEHAGKFMREEGARSYDLVEEAWWVLNEATKRHPKANLIFKDL